MSVINLQRLPSPEIIERGDYEQRLAVRKARLIEEAPDLAPVLELESDPLVKLLEVDTYHEILIRAEFDDAARGALLALASGPDLDHLGALPFFNVTRLVVQEANDTAIPPVPAILETDDDFRTRIQLSLSGSSAAGPGTAYEFNARSAHSGVRDARASSPTPGHVAVHVLGRDGDGSPSAEILQAVNDRLQDDDVRQLCATVEVQPAEILTYQVEASLTLLPGPDQSLVLATVRAAIEDRVSDLHAMGRDITLSALTGPLDQSGVQEALLTSPAERIEVDDHQAAYCTGVTLIVSGRDV